MLQGALDLKLDEETSQKLVARTLKASALLSENKNFIDLIEKIASPGGTTHAALDSFKKADFDKIVGDAIKAAKNRAKELSKGK
jgi:pyrroline-5-carboxylate reductase